jgi:hypothetical protein
MTRLLKRVVAQLQHDLGLDCPRIARRNRVFVYKMKIEHYLLLASIQTGLSAVFAFLSFLSFAHVM